jgi:hypothetical protein
MGCRVFEDTDYANHMPKEFGIRNQVISKRYSTVLFLDKLPSMG